MFDKPGPSRLDYQGISKMRTTATRIEVRGGEQVAEGDKMVHVLLIESESPDTIDKATKRLSGISGANYMHYALRDSHLRIVFSALREAAVSSL